LEFVSLIKRGEEMFLSGEVHLLIPEAKKVGTLAEVFIE